MRKSFFAGAFVFALLGALHGGGQAQDKPKDLSGTWVLDKTKTSDLPPTLESYTLSVEQTQEQLIVATQLRGEIPRRVMGRGPGGQGGPGGGRGGGGFPGGGAGGPGGGGIPGGSAGGPGGGGFPGGGGGFSIPKDAVMGMALQMGVQQATYQLDGKETVVELEPRQGGEGQPQQPGGSLVLKASWKKNGKVLELQSTRKINLPDGERSITSKDRWELSEDGQTLTVKRSVEMPMGTQEARLVFSKQ